MLFGVDKDRLPGMQWHAFIAVCVPADLKVYPNPASNYINIELPEGNEYVDVAIFGVDGKQVVAYSLSGFSASQPVHIDVSGLKNGMYFFRVQGPETQHTARFIKKIVKAGIVLWLLSKKRIC